MYPCRMNVALSLPIEPDLPVDPPEAYAEAVVRRAGTSFFWAMRRLSAERRRGVFAVYAFCREVDDIADGELPLDRKSAMLELWRSEIDSLFAGAPSHPIGRALQDAIHTYALRRDDFIAVIDGMEMDACPRVRIKDRAELRLYCDRVACAVGRLCNPVFGIAPAHGQRLAAALGEAMQLTNILRDIVEDAGRDRVYLPADALARAGAGGDGIEDLLTAPGLPELCAGLAAEAEALFAEAQAIIDAEDTSATRPAVMMMQVYKSILINLQRRGWRELATPVGPGKWGKLMIAVRYGLFG